MAASSDEDSDGNSKLPRVAAEKSDSRWVFMFLNGDEYFKPLRTLVNQRHYRSLESLLEKLTERIRPSFGAIRSVYTPRQGHRVGSIEELHSNERYVAAGYEKFRQLPQGYPDVEQLGRLNQARKLAAKANQMQAPRKTVGGPAFNRLNRFEAPITVYIHKNGSQREAPVRCVLIGRDRINMIRVLLVIGQRMKLEASYVKKLCFPEGNLVQDVEDLKNGGHYVALLPHESFKKPSSKLPNNYMRTYETLAHNASGKPASTIAATDYEQEDDDRPEVALKNATEEIVPMKEASTSTTEDKATTTPTPHEDDAQRPEDIGAPKVIDEPAQPESQSENLATPEQSQTDQPIAKAENEVDTSRDVQQEERTRMHSEASNANVAPKQATPEKTETPKPSNVIVNQSENTEGLLRDELAEDGLEIAYAAPINDEKRLQELAEHLHYLSHSANQKNETSSPDKRPKTQGDDNMSIMSLNSFYEKEQAQQEAERAASTKRSASQQSRKRDSFSALQEQWEFDRGIKEDVETGEPFTNGDRSADVPAESRFSGHSNGRGGSEEGSRNRALSHRKSSESIHSGKSIGAEPIPASNQDITTPQNNEPAERSETRKERRASDVSLASLTRYREAPEANDRGTSHSRRLSLQESVGSRTSDRKSSKGDDRSSTRGVRERSSQGRIPNGGIPEKALPKNVAPSGSSSAARKSVDESRIVSQTKSFRRGPEKKAVGTKSGKRSTDEDSGNRGWSRASSDDSLKSNKDSGYSPASVRSKDSSETSQRQKKDEKTSQAQAAARVSSKDFQETLETYSISPPHSPIRTYAYLLQPKPAEPSYEFRISESGRVGQATYSAAPLRYSSTARNQWKPDTYPILEEEDVFYAKPSRGRKFEAPYKEVDLDEDNGGVFRARRRASELGAAVEVQESKDTKVDVPIDDMEALEVEEEYLPPEHRRIERDASGGPGHRIVTFLPSAGSSRCISSSDRRNMARLLTREDIQRMIL